MPARSYDEKLLLSAGPLLRCGRNDLTLTEPGRPLNSNVQGPDTVTNSQLKHSGDFHKNSLCMISREDVYLSPLMPYSSHTLVSE